MAAEAAGAKRALEAQVAALEAATAASGPPDSSAGSSSEAVAQSLRGTVAELEMQLQAMRRASSGRCACNGLEVPSWHSGLGHRMSSQGLGMVMQIHA